MISSPSRPSANSCKPSTTSSEDSSRAGRSASGMRRTAAGRSRAIAMSSAPSPKVVAPTMPKKRSGFFVKRTRKNTLKISSARCTYSRGAIRPSKRSLRRLPHVDLADAEALAVREHRQEAMLVAVQRDLLEHAASHGARAAAEVAIALPGDACDERRGTRCAAPVRAAAGARPAMADRHVGAARARARACRSRRLDLVIGRQRQDHVRRARAGIRP